jgi:hypothetical protein
VLSIVELEGIEVYRSRRELPFELAGTGECGVIAFWTRTSQPTRGGLWRYLAAGGLVAAVTVLLVAR